METWTLFINVIWRPVSYEGQPYWKSRAHRKAQKRFLHEFFFKQTVIFSWWTNFSWLDFCFCCTIFLHFSVYLRDRSGQSFRQYLGEDTGDTHVGEGEDQKYSDSPKKTTIKTDSRPTIRSFQFVLQLVHRASQPCQQLPQRGFSLCLEHY